MVIDLEDFRRANGSIDLESATRSQAKLDDRSLTMAGQDFIVMVERLRPIVSRQAAAIAIATALTIKERWPS